MVADILARRGYGLQTTQSGPWIEIIPALGGPDEPVAA